jgi:hypothetical protein
MARFTAKITVLMKANRATESPCRSRIILLLLFEVVEIAADLLKVLAVLLGIAGVRRFPVRKPARR